MNDDYAGDDIEVHIRRVVREELEAFSLRRASGRFLSWAEEKYPLLKADWSEDGTILLRYSHMAEKPELALAMKTWNRFRREEGLEET